MYQKYSIGTMARLLGISAEAIRYYESRNIIQPVRDPETGYRYYNTWDFHMLLRARHYQNYGFSLEEVADPVSYTHLTRSALPANCTQSDAILICFSTVIPPCFITTAQAPAPSFVTLS